jgi:hypothetical protein
LAFTSCIDDCSGQASYYRLIGFNGEAKEFVPTDPGWQTKPWSNTINLTTEKLILQFVFEEEFLDKKDFTRSAISGLPVLFACDPAVNLEAGLERIEVSVDKDFNLNFPAGSDLSGILLVSNGTSQFRPLEEFRDTRENVFRFTNFFVKFSQDAEQSEPMNFKCTVTLRDGRQFSSSIENIILRVN